MSRRTTPPPGVARHPENHGGVRVLPAHRLPPGFPSSLEEPPRPPATPRPSATLCLLRDGARGPEALLLKRTPRARFIPGAWVFPGGTVDPGDGAPALQERLTGLEPERAGELLGVAPDETPPPLAYWVAALRETFEETAHLPAAKASRHAPVTSIPGKREATGAGAPGPALPTHRVLELRDALLSGRVTFQEVLQESELTLDAGALAYVGHWITPVVEPLRFDTRFFAAVAPGDTPIDLHEAELVEALWLTPEKALERNREGTLPLVFPTLRTLEELAPFSTAREALKALGGRAVPRLLPRLVAAPGGIGIVVEE